MIGFERIQHWDSRDRGFLYQVTMGKDAYGSEQWFEQQFYDAGRTGEDSWGHQWRISQRYRYALSLEAIRGVLPPGKTIDILDIGCGIGDFAGLIHQVNGNARFCGLDISEAAVSVARKRYPFLDARRGALPTIPFSRKFDGIAALESLYYLNEEERIAAVAMIRESLKPGGWFLFSSLLGDPRRYFTEESSCRLLQEAGFQIKKKLYNFSLPYLFFERFFLKAVSLHRRIQDNDPLKPKVVIQRELRQDDNFLREGTERITGKIAALVRYILTRSSLFRICLIIGKMARLKSHIILLAVAETYTCDISESDESIG